MTEAYVLGGVALVSYLIGAIPFGYLVARWRGVDILRTGSGNIGATNVGRVLGRKFGLLVFALDFLKGALPTLAAFHLAPGVPADQAGVVAGLSAFLGHLFPVYLRFRGGKGVATGAGVVAILVPVPALAAVATWLVVVSSSLIVSLASLAAGLGLCAFRLLLTPQPFAPDNRTLTLFCLVATLLVFVRHHANLRRLLAGRENRLEDPTTAITLARTLHVLSVGLWFGMGIFFSFVVAFTLFRQFEALAEREDYDPVREASEPGTTRPSWFTVSPYYSRAVEGGGLPQPLRKEQGTRAAGFAIGPMFHWYYLLQLGCAAVAVVTAAGWWRQPGRVHRVRVFVLGGALVLAGVGWWLENKVKDLGAQHHQMQDDLLITDPPSQNQKDETAKARADFGKWHGISMLVNVIALVLVTGAMALAAHLPPVAGARNPAGSPGGSA